MNRQIGLSLSALQVTEQIENEFLQFSLYLKQVAIPSALTHKVTNSKGYFETIAMLIISFANYIKIIMNYNMNKTITNNILWQIFCLYLLKTFYLYMQNTQAFLLFIFEYKLTKSHSLLNKAQREARFSFCTLY